MRRDAAIASIVDLCKAGDGFRLDAATLAAEVATPTRAALVEALLECGVIPESFGHDSTEEKMFAKYCDVLLAKSLEAMGLKSSVMWERADAADVEGRNDAYSIVGDAKAFRLSRTAKNQKDFKVTALSGWRGKRDYACLVCPLYQYPNTRSQIYKQATSQNVALLGYVHLAFLVANSEDRVVDLSPVWNIGAGLPHSDEAGSYWLAIDNVVCKSVTKTTADLQDFKRREWDILQLIKAEEIAHLKGEVERVLTLTKEELVQRLISEMNLTSRMAMIDSAYQNKPD